MFFAPNFETNTSLGRFFPQFVFQSKDLLPLVTILAGKMTMILSQKQELVRAKEKPTKPIRWSFVALLENCFCFIIYWWSSPTAMSALAPMHNVSICVFFWQFEKSNLLFKLFKQWDKIEGLASTHLANGFCLIKDKKRRVYNFTSIYLVQRTLFGKR